MRLVNKSLRKISELNIKEETCGTRSYNQDYILHIHSADTVAASGLLLSPLPAS